MYNKIYDFCKVRNLGTVYDNSDIEPTPRVKFLMELLDSEGIKYELDKSHSLRRNITIYNIILRGTSDKMVVAHHDVNNCKIDNANDNSCSCINAIMIKKLRPHINVVLLDGEEFGGIGSQKVSEQINDGEFGPIKWVLNLELTGKGGENFFVGNYPGPLQKYIISLFNCPVVNTPFNDSVIFRRNDIDSCVINPIPILPEGEKSSVVYNGNYLDYSMLFNCHHESDNIASIDPADMKEFVEKVVLKIIDTE